MTLFPGKTPLWPRCHPFRHISVVQVGKSWENSFQLRSPPNPAAYRLAEICYIGEIPRTSAPQVLDVAVVRVKVGPSWPNEKDNFLGCPSEVSGLGINICNIEDLIRVGRFRKWWIFYQRYRDELSWNFVWSVVTCKEKRRKLKLLLVWCA